MSLISLEVTITYVDSSFVFRSSNCLDISVRSVPIVVPIVVFRVVILFCSVLTASRNSTCNASIETPIAAIERVFSRSI